MTVTIKPNATNTELKAQPKNSSLKNAMIGLVTNW
jgi:hypothetical protein